MGGVFNEELDPKLLCQYLAGECSIKRLQDPALGSRIINDEEQEVLKQSIKEISVSINKNLNDVLVNILTDISRFRLHLKYTRFAHRIFNRVSILTDDSDIEFS